MSRLVSNDVLANIITFSGSGVSKLVLNDEIRTITLKGSYFDLNCIKEHQFSDDDFKLMLSNPQLNKRDLLALTVRSKQLKWFKYIIERKIAKIDTAIIDSIVESDLVDFWKVITKPDAVYDDEIVETMIRTESPAIAEYMMQDNYQPKSKTRIGVLAAKCGYLEILKRWLELVDDVRLTLDRILDLAIDLGRVEIVRLVVSDPRYRPQPLDLPVTQNTDYEIMELLLARFQPTDVANEKMWQLVDLDRIDLLKLFLKYKTSSIDEDSINIAIESGNYTMAQLLIDHRLGQFNNSIFVTIIKSKQRKLINKYLRRLQKPNDRIVDAVIYFNDYQTLKYLINHFQIKIKPSMLIRLNRSRKYRTIRLVSTLNAKDIKPKLILNAWLK